jgi:hypothetical protein
VNPWTPSFQAEKSPENPARFTESHSPLPSRSSTRGGACSPADFEREGGRAVASVGAGRSQASHHHALSGFTLDAVCRKLREGASRLEVQFGRHLQAVATSYA